MARRPQHNSPNKTDKGAAGDSADPQRRPSPGLLIPRSSYGWALLTSLLLAGWFVTGTVSIGGRQNPQQPQPASESRAPDTSSTGTTSRKASGSFAVRTRLSVARPRQATLALRGRTEATAQIAVKAQTAGVVEAIHEGKGQRVAKGTLLCRIATGTRQAELDRARAALARANQRYQASRALARKGHVSKNRLLADRAERDAARAALEKARLDLAYTRITAPFAGIIEAQPAKPGDYLQIGGTCAVLVKLDPLLLRADVSETDISQLRPGQRAHARLATGQRVRGKIRFISSVADARTRTFKIEIEVANPDDRLKHGVTASITLPLASRPAHFLPPSLLVLDTAGRVGVKLVDAAGRVVFRPVNVLQHGKNGVWVAGLPERAQVVTVGQDYVRDGQQVKAEPGPPLPAPPANPAHPKARG